MIRSCFILFICILLMQSICAMEKIIDWTLIHPISGDSIPFGTHGSVQEALMHNGSLPDPHCGTNELQFAWIEEYQWTLISTFSILQSDHSHEIIELELPSVDTYADVYLNNQLILQCNNAFLPYRIQIDKWIKTEKNNLRIVFTPPVLFHASSYKKAKYILPTTNDTHNIAVAPYTRKPQYQFGWDWTFRMNTIGLNKPITCVKYAHNKIVLSTIQTLTVENEQAQLLIGIELSQAPQKNLRWTSQLFGEIDFQQKQHWLEAHVAINHAKLWWPKNHGEQFLYHDHWILSDNNGTLIDQRDISFGIRTVQLVQEKDQWGTSYQFVVNQRPIFCKGGNYIPQEVFLAKISDSSTINLIEQADRANFNMIRVWGGGYYPDEIFYRECDKRGIMVWQDFMFACAMYPGTNDFLDNVKREVNAQIPRISSHPSVVLLNGNNEVDIAWKHWGYQLKYGLIGKSAKEIKRAYHKLFEELIPACVQQLSTVPYIHTSPLSHWGKDEYYRHGSQHYWGVWHGKDPIEDFGNKSGRFNAEYGFQSFPEYATLNRVIDKKEWSIDSETMKLRQKSYVGNKMIQKHADRLFGPSNNFETFIYYSQLTQARAMSIAMAAHRTQWPRCAGTIYWQLNDCWPAPTWSTIDYYGNWKAAHYQVQQDFKNISILAVEQTLHQQRFYLVSDWIDTPYTTEIHAEFFDLDGKLFAHQTHAVEVTPQMVKELSFLDPTLKDSAEYILRMTWRDEFGDKQQRMFYTIRPKPSQQEPIVEIELIQVNDTETKLVFTCDRPLIACWIYSETKFLHLDRNFATLLPGQHTFTIKNAENLRVEDISYRFL